LVEVAGSCCYAAATESQYLFQGSIPAYACPLGAAILAKPSYGGKSGGERAISPRGAQPLGLNAE